MQAALRGAQGPLAGDESVEQSHGKCTKRPAQSRVNCTALPSRLARGPARLLHGRWSIRQAFYGTARRAILMLWSSPPRSNSKFRAERDGRDRADAAGQHLQLIAKRERMGGQNHHSGGLCGCLALGHLAR